MINGLNPAMTLAVGVEEDEDGSVRVYIASRHLNLHTHVALEPELSELRAAWAKSHHVFVTAPRPEDLCGCRQELEPIPEGVFR